MDWLNELLCYLNGKYMFALSKGNKRKWVNGIELHCITCYNLASLDEQAQILCHCVHTVCGWFGDYALYGTAAWACTCACCAAHSLRDMTSDRQQSMKTSDAEMIHLITYHCLPPESKLSGKDLTSQWKIKEERGDTTAHRVAAKFKKDKSRKGDGGCTNNRLTMLSISAGP